jgi:hypothetical protein
MLDLLGKIIHSEQTGTVDLPPQRTFYGTAKEDQVMVLLLTETPGTKTPQEKQQQDFLFLVTENTNFCLACAR